MHAISSEMIKYGMEDTYAFYQFKLQSINANLTITRLIITRAGA